MKVRHWSYNWLSLTNEVIINSVRIQGPPSELLQPPLRMDLVLASGILPYFDLCLKLFNVSSWLKPVVLPFSHLYLTASSIYL